MQSFAIPSSPQPLAATFLLSVSMDLPSLDISQKRNHTICGLFLFVCFWLRWVFVVAHGFSLVVSSGGYSLLQCVGFSLRWLLLLWSLGSRCTGFSGCSTRAQQLWLMGSRAQAQQLWCTGLVAARRVGSSQTRGQTHVPCIGRQILNHCATSEVLAFCICLFSFNIMFSRFIYIVGYISTLFLLMAE